MNKTDTSEYSSSKAPETREHAEERDHDVDPRLLPGGAEPRSNTAQGMAGLDRETIPSQATDTAQIGNRDTTRKDVVTGE